MKTDTLFTFFTTNLLGDTLKNASTKVRNFYSPSKFLKPNGLLGILKEIFIVSPRTLIQSTMINSKTTLLNIFAFLLAISVSVPASFGQADEKAQRKAANKFANDARRLSKKGSHVMALYFSVNAVDGPLKRKKREKAISIFQESFNGATDELLKSIKTLTEQSQEFSGESTVHIRKKIVDDFGKLVTCIDTTKSVSPSTLAEAGIPNDALIDYSEELTVAKVKYDTAVSQFIRQSYADGLADMALGTKSGHRDAHYHFRKIGSYITNYRNSDSLRRYTREQGTYRLVIARIENKTGRTVPSDLGYTLASAVHRGLSSTSFEMLEILPLDASNSSKGTNLSVESIARNYAQSHNADMVLYGTLYDFQHKVSERSVEKYDHSKEINDGSWEWRTDSEGKKYKYQPKKTVSATTFFYRQSQKGDIKGNLYLYSVPDGEYVASSVILAGTSDHENAWTKMTGDKRALNSASHIVKSDPPLKKEAEMLKIAAESMMPSFSKKFGELYSKL